MRMTAYRNCNWINPQQIYRVFFSKKKTVMKTQLTYKVFVLFSFQTMTAGDVVCTRVYERE